MDMQSNETINKECCVPTKEAGRTAGQAGTRRFGRRFVVLRGLEPQQPSVHMSLVVCPTCSEPFQAESQPPVMMRCGHVSCEPCVETMRGLNRCLLCNGSAAPCSTFAAVADLVTHFTSSGECASCHGVTDCASGGREDREKASTSLPARSSGAAAAPAASVGNCMQHPSNPAAYVVIAGETKGYLVCNACLSSAHDPGLFTHSAPINSTAVGWLSSAIRAEINKEGVRLQALVRHQEDLIALREVVGSVYDTSVADAQQQFDAFIARAKQMHEAHVVTTRIARDDVFKAIDIESTATDVAVGHLAAAIAYGDACIAKQELESLAKGYSCIARMDGMASRLMTQVKDRGVFAKLAFQDFNPTALYEALDFAWNLRKVCFVRALLRCLCCAPGNVVALSRWQSVTDQRHEVQTVSGVSARMVRW